MPGTTIARGNTLAEKIFSVSITPTAVAANTTSEQNFTVQGLQSGDYINANAAGTQTAGIFVASVRITTTNVATIMFANCTTASATPVSGTYGLIWGRPESLPLETNAL